MIFGEATLLRLFAPPPAGGFGFIDSTLPGSEFVLFYKVTRPKKKRKKRKVGNSLKVWSMYNTYTYIHT